MIVIYSLLRCWCYTICFKGDKFTIKSGVFLKQTAEISIDSVSSVQSIVSPFDILFKTVTYKINTEAGRKNKSDYVIKLKKSQGDEFCERIYGETPIVKQRFSAFKVAIMAAATSSAFTGLIIVVPLINKAGDLLGVALRDMLLDEINNASEKLGNVFSPIANTVTIILLISYLVAFLYSFLKYVNFRIRLGDAQLEVRSGIYERLRTHFKKSSVNNVVIEQTPIMLLIKQFSMKVSVGGFGESKGESQMVVPCAKRDEIKQDFENYFPFLVAEGDTIQTKKDKISKARFLFLPSIYLLLVLASSFLLALIFKDFGKLIFFISTILMVIVFYFAYLSIYESKFGYMTLGKTVFIKSINNLRTRELYCPKENIGQITIKQFPMDRQYGSCCIKFFVRSESADSIKLRIIDFELAKSQVYKTFGLE